MGRERDGGSGLGRGQSLEEGGSGLEVGLQRQGGSNSQLPSLHHTHTVMVVHLYTAVPAAAG